MFNPVKFYIRKFNILFFVFAILGMWLQLSLPAFAIQDSEIKESEPSIKTEKTNKKLKKNDTNAAAYCVQFTFNTFFKLGFVFADNILTKFVSKKTNKNGLTIYRVQKIGKTDISFCIESNGVYSHGDTLKEAKESLIYKISNRDTSMYEDYTPDTVVTFEEGIKMYRVITGACEAGTRHFVKGLTKKKKKYTVAEIIKATQGQYGNETFKEFFNE